MANITKEFLEKALGGKEVESFEVNSGSNPGDGYASNLYTVDVTLASGTSEVTDVDNSKTPEAKKKVHLLLKCFPTNVGRQGVMSEGNIFRRELLVYSTIIPELIQFQLKYGKNQVVYQPPFPTFYFGQAVDYDALGEGESTICTDPLENCIIMADLRKSGGFKLANRLTGFDVHHARLVITAYAKLHALSWAYKQLTNTPSLLQKFNFPRSAKFDTVVDTMMEGIASSNLKLFAKTIQDSSSIDDDTKVEYLKSIDRFKLVNLDANRLYFSNTAPKDSSVNKDNILRVPQPHLEDEEPWLVLTHGDCWLNNMMFRYDEATGEPVEVILVDLQVTKEGDPFSDVAYNLYTCTTADLRKQHLADLLKLYFQTFTEVCDSFKVEPLPGFTYEEVHRRFHRAIIFVFAISIVGLPVYLTEEKDVTVLEQIEGDEGDGMKAMVDMMAGMGDGMKNNTVFADRVIGLVRELHAEGVI